MWYIGTTCTMTIYPDVFIHWRSVHTRIDYLTLLQQPRSVMIQTLEPEESRSGEDALTPQYRVSVAGHPKNRLYLDSGASLHIIFNRELLGGLIKLDKATKF